MIKKIISIFALVLAIPLTLEHMGFTINLPYRINTVPESVTMLLLGFALGGLFGSREKFHKNNVKTMGSDLKR